MKQDKEDAINIYIKVVLIGKELSGECVRTPGGTQAPVRFCVNWFEQILLKIWFKMCSTKAQYQQTWWLSFYYLILMLWLLKAPHGKI